MMTQRRRGRRLKRKMVVRKKKCLKIKKQKMQMKLKFKKKTPRGKRRLVQGAGFKILAGITSCIHCFCSHPHSLHNYWACYNAEF